VTESGAAFERRQRLLAVLAVVWAAAIFGTSFVVVKRALGEVRPIPYITLRFGLAGLVLLALSERARRSGRGTDVAQDVLRTAIRRRRAADAAVDGTASPDDRRTGVDVGHSSLRRLGVLAGLSYAAAMVGQTIGLTRISAASSAFLTYLLVVAVPVIAFLRTGVRPERRTITAITVAIVGLALLTGGQAGLGSGALLTLGAAIAFAWHLVVVGDAAVAGHDPLRFNAVQCLVIAAVLAPAVPLTGGLPSTPRAWLVVVYAALVVTVLTSLPWSWAAKHLASTRVALILLLEPVFAAVTDVLTGGHLHLLALLGAALILAGAALSLTSATQRDPSTTR
jgi:drug/metabolite transporter (DMT)-like permease